jgi:hypothetical protein
VATLSSSDIEEALELLSLSPARGQRSPFSETHSSSGSDLLDDWPEANDMAASVYNALTADDSNFCALMASALQCAQKPCADGSSTRQSRSLATSSQQPQRRKSVLASAL